MSDDRGHTARFELAVGLTPAEAFDYFSDVARLDEVTPSWFRLDPIDGPPSRLEVDTRIDYRFRWRHLPMRWRSRITLWEPPTHFAYEQERGPYRLFRHVHLFDPIPGGTRVVDLVTFRTPFGAWLDRSLVAADLARVFAFRRAHTERLFPLTHAAGDDRHAAAPDRTLGEHAFE